MQISPYARDKRYGVTHDGRVFRLERIGAWPAGECTQHLGKRGYWIVMVGGRHTYVHRMVAETFIPNPHQKREVAHNDGSRTNNRVENLRWATRAENDRDMDEHGTRSIGERHPGHLLTVDQVKKIQDLTAGKLPRQPPLHRDIAAIYGVSREMVTRIANRQRWNRATAS